MVRFASRGYFNGRFKEQEKIELAEERKKVSLSLAKEIVNKN